MLEHQPVLVPGPRAGHHRRLEERAQPAPTPFSPRLPSPGSLRSDLHPPNDRLSLALDQLLGSRQLRDRQGFICRERVSCPLPSRGRCSTTGERHLCPIEPFFPTECVVMLSQPLELAVIGLSQVSYS